MPGDSLVYLAYSFPPVSSGANTRNLLLPKYMPRFGWRFNVLTCSNPVGMHLDRSLLERIPRETPVHRVPHRWPRPGSAGGTAAGSPAGERGRRLRRLLKSFLMVPDRLITWAPDVIPAGVRLVRETGSDMILSAGPHHSMHLHAWAISSLTGARWAPYFGDLWLYDSYMRRPPAPVRAVHAALERMVVRSADGIVTTTPLSSEYFRRRYGADCPPTTEVVNGYDPETTPVGSPPPSRGDRLLRVAYTGNLFAENATELLPEALSMLLSREPDAPIRLVVAGYVEPWLAERLRSGACGRVTELLGRLPAEEAAREQRRADLLLAMLSDRPGSEVKNPAKLAEYVVAGRPVLAVAREGDLTSFMRRLGAGYVCPPDPGSLAAALGGILEDWRRGAMRGAATPEACAGLFDMRRNIAGLAGFLRGLERRPRGLPPSMAR